MANKQQKTSDLSIEKDERILRTANADFSAKQKRFLANIQRGIRDGDDHMSDDSCVYIDEDDEKDADFEIVSTKRKKSTGKRASVVTPKTRDMFCWFCHKDRGSKILCTTCTRVYHYQCAKVNPVHTDEKYRCYECIELDNTKKIDANQFTRMLKFVLHKIVNSIKAKEKFHNLIRKEEYPKHLTYAIDLNEIIKNVNAKKYTSGKAFILDISWIGHIYCAYFPARKLAIEDVRHLQKFCKDEIFNIETCAACFVRCNSKTCGNWFTKVCAKPHLLIWAKLSGYPYWPAKVMSVYENVLAVHFFGEHERAFVPAKDCYLYSREDPNPVQPKTFRQQNFLNCVAEATEYIKNISAKFGEFCYAALKTPLNPKHLENYVVDSISGFEGNQSETAPTMHLTRRTSVNVATTSKSNFNELSGIVASTPQVKGRRAVTLDFAKLNGRHALIRDLTDTPSLSAEKNAVREAKYIEMRRKMLDESKALYYKTKYAKIIEDPGMIVLDRIDLTASPALENTTDENETNDFIESTVQPQSNDSVANKEAAINQAPHTTSNSNLDSSQNISPFARITANDKIINTNSYLEPISPTKTIKTSTFDHSNPQPSTSAHASCNSGFISATALEMRTVMTLPEAPNSPKSIVPPSSYVCETDLTNQEALLMDMVTRLPSMVKAAKEKIESLQNDWDTIANFSKEIKKWKATIDRTKADRNLHCVNCGKSARLFCNWSTAYCNYTCREQYRAKYGEIHAENENDSATKK